ncbi:hypothetical protein FRC19_003576 [Serendipita sp. 401]|nr:hypothetical protein FRC19_003576 [Serendipita sp. 401]
MCVWGSLVEETWNYQSLSGSFGPFVRMGMTILATEKTHCMNNCRFIPLETSFQFVRGIDLTRSSGTNVSIILSIHLSVAFQTGRWSYARGSQPLLTRLHRIQLSVSYGALSGVMTVIVLRQPLAQYLEGP